MFFSSIVLRTKLSSLIIVYIIHSDGHALHIIWVVFEIFDKEYLSFLYCQVSVFNKTIYLCLLVILIYVHPAGLVL